MVYYCKVFGHLQAQRPNSGGVIRIRFPCLYQWRLLTLQNSKPRSHSNASNLTCCSNVLYIPISTQSSPWLMVICCMNIIILSQFNATTIRYLLNERTWYVRALILRIKRMSSPPKHTLFQHFWQSWKHPKCTTFLTNDIIFEWSTYYVFSSAQSVNNDEYITFS